MNEALYHFLRIPAWIVINFLFLPKVYNAKNLRFKKSCIVIANHTSNWDPILLGHLVFPVCLKYMAKQELFNKGLKNKFLRALGVIPVMRGKSDLKAVKMALTALKKGKSLGIFPEGHRSEGGQMLPFEPGPAVIALKTNTAVLPVYMDCRGYRLFRRVRIMTGEMLDVNDFKSGRTDAEAVVQITALLQNTMLQLKERLERYG